MLGDGAAPLERVAELAAQLGDGARGVGGEAAAEPEGDLAEREAAGGRRRERVLGERASGSAGSAEVPAPARAGSASVAVGGGGFGRRAGMSTQNSARPMRTHEPLPTRTTAPFWRRWPSTVAPARPSTESS